MEQALIISNILLWILVVILAGAVLALTRQIGVLYERVAPAGALMVGQGPKAGEAAPQVQFPDIDNNLVSIGGASAEGRSTLLFFLSPSCPVCATLIPVLKSLRQTENKWLDIVLASDGDEDRQREFIKEKDLAGFPFILSMQLGMAFQVGKLPYAVLIDENGVISSKGLTNTREHIESLFEAKEQGVASIQEYMSKQQQGAA